MRAAGGTSLLPNDDSHLAIEYFNVSGASQALCGHYSAATATFVAAGGYSQATCVIPGNLVRVTLSNSYPLMTKLLGAGFASAITVKAVAVMPVMA